MAGQRQPIELLQAKNKKHLTKEEIKKREATEVKAPCDNIVCPEYLPQALKKDFDYITSILIKIGIMSNLDCDAVARFLLNQAEYLQYTKKLFSLMNQVKWNVDEVKTIASLKQKAYNQCRSAANDLGLSISSRCRLVAPNSDADIPPQNKFAKFINKYDKN